MNDDITVYVVDYGRKYLQMRYTDANGNQHTRSTRSTNRRDAERVAARWEADLRAGIAVSARGMPWAEFRIKFETGHLHALRDSSRRRVSGLMDLYERHMKPATIRDVTAEAIAEFQSLLRVGIPLGKRKQVPRSEATIRGVSQKMRAMLRYAFDMGYLPAMPRLRRTPKAPATSKLMRGRPLTADEFESIVKAIPAAINARHAPQWERLLRGLWLSGLRLDEAVALSWDDPNVIMVDMTGRRPMFRVVGDGEKGGQDRLLPMTPDFAEFLDRTPAENRAGIVFPLPKRKHRTPKVRSEWVGKMVSKIGKQAGIVVDSRTGKTASAHDLRRSFASRWATRVMPQVLMELMRHGDISTTLEYYAGQNADRTADAVWNAWNTENQGVATNYTVKVTEPGNTSQNQST